MLLIKQSRIGIQHVEEIESKKPNAYKFERFIFDALPHAKTALVVEADRQREFNPVKNKEGNDSPETSRSALTAIHTQWLLQTGVDVPANVPVEISPLFALDATEVKAQIESGRSLAAPDVFMGE